MRRSNSKRGSRSIEYSALASLCLSLASVSPLSSQESSIFEELGVFAISTSSEHVELPSPMGFGGFARFRIGGPFDFRLSYHRVSDETHKTGVVCDQYSQRINCRPEMTHTTVGFSSVRGGVSGGIQFGKWVRIRLDGGVSFSHVTPESVDDTGWRADLLDPNTGQVGYFTGVSTTVSVLENIPLKLIGGVTSHWVEFNGCSGEDPPQYDPFCGRAVSRDLELGLSFAF